MAIVLAILKWIGIVAGGVLGLAVLFVCLILFVPVRYYLAGDNRDTLCYQFRVSWLCRAVSLIKKRNSDEICFRIFGISVFRSGGEGPAQTPVEDAGEGKQPEPLQKQEEVTQSSASSGGTEKRKHRAASPKSNSRKKRKKKSAGKKTASRKKSFSFDVLSGIINFVRDTENRRAFRKIRQEIRLLFRYLTPQKIRGYFVIGTGDPSSTGLLIGGISLLPFVYQDGLDITPDFEEKIFQADGMIKGRIQVLYFFRLCIRLYRDKELRKLWSNIQKLKKEAA